MRKQWDDDAWDEYVDWQAKDNKTLKRINELLKDIDRNGHRGKENPKPLKHIPGYWSREIDQKNRLVYKIENGIMSIIQCGTHYRDN